jgi:endonuclease/exonuclease/phosphatase family metal-dependent hydrolase
LISRLAVRLRWLRRVLGRTHWVAALLGVKPPSGEADEPGLLVLQIDGLSRTQLEHALATGRLPFLNDLLRRQHFTLETFYSGVPSTTPAVQGEIFYGVRTAVPSFQFLRRRTGKVVRMYEAEAADEIGRELEAACPDPLLRGGHTYSNIFRGGAAQSHYCSPDLSAGSWLRNLHPFKSLLLAVLYAPRILPIIGLAVVEAVLAMIDAFKGLFEREDFIEEMTFIPSRVIVCSLLRELIRLRVLLDIERGVPVVHANFLGYDEQAHRRGPGSSFAHWTLKGIDRSLRDISRAAARSTHRDYELIVYSDHGQEHTEPFARRHGRDLGEALAGVLNRGSLAGHPLWTDRTPPQRDRPAARLLQLAGQPRPAPAAAGPPDPAHHIILTAMGPLGHLYFPVTLGDEESLACAKAVAAEAGVPLVLFRTGPNSVAACNRRGHWNLPEERAEVLGAEHPFLDEVAADLIRLCHHPDAGHLVLSGWDPSQPPLSFPMENGAHGGPGSEETRGFLLVPDRIRRWHLAHLAMTGDRVRGAELHRIILHFLGRDGTRQERVPSHHPRLPSHPLRLMTYNIHSCLGLDGKIRPERIARVINHFDPDVAAVQEIDVHRPRTGHHDQAQLIADHLRMDHEFHAVLEEEKEKYGIALFARHPFEVVKSGLLTEAHHSRIREPRGAVWIRLHWHDQRPIHIINTHFGLGREERRRQTEALLGPDWLGSIPHDEPVIVCGDFNSGPRSPVLQKLRARLRDVQLAAPGHQPLPTFSSLHPLVRIDHIFVSPHFRVEHVEVPDTPTASLASDHLPLCVQLSLPA